MKPVRVAPDWTVIVATYNRAESLCQTLKTLAFQATDGQFTYEVLVSDNGSTDHTRAAVKALQPDFPAPLRYCYEGRRGKSWALNTGIAHARGRFLAFTDDDVLATPTWLARLWQCFREEAADAIGGKVVPRWTAPRPAWLTDEMVRRLDSLGCLDYGDRRLLKYYRWVGGNVAIRRDVVERVGGYDVRLARTQDTEYYQRCRRAGLTIVYEPTAVVQHQIGPERMTPAYFRQWRARTGYYHAYLHQWRKYHLLTIMPMSWYQVMGRWLARWVMSVVRFRPWQDRFVPEIMLRDYGQQFLHRVQMWPAWCAAVVCGRSRQWSGLPAQQSR